jgi:hypothetical protein
MTEKTEKIHIELKSGESGITSFAGLWPAVELFRKAGLPRTIDSAVGARSSRGFRDSEHILSLVLLHLSGGSAADHLPFLKEKLSFEKLGISVPSPSALRKWLNEFHNGDEDGKRGMGKAFIPEENGYLKGLGTVLSRLFAFAVTGAPRKHITLDQDATFIETEESGANWNYKGQKSYQALNTYCPQYDLVAGTRYGDGNVPPGWKQKEELERILHNLPGEVKGVSLRSDSAGYQTDLLTWCTEGKHSRFGYIPVGISSPVGEEFKKAVRAVPEEDWKPLCRAERNGTTGGETNSVHPVQEWAEVVYVPINLGRKKHGRDYRFLAVRERWDGLLSPQKDRQEEGKTESEAEAVSSPGDQLYFTEAIRLLEEEAPGVKKLHLLDLGGRVYKTFGIVTNIEDGADGGIFGYGQGDPMDGEKIIRWQRKRSGKAEEIHHILKDELGGGHVPSKRFGANAAWWTIAVLALNLHNLMKRHLLPEEYGKSRPKSIRFLLYTMVGKIVTHGRRTVLKIWTGDRGGPLFASVMKRLELLQSMPD